jgi:hypothetical protein
MRAESSAEKSHNLSPSFDLRPRQRLLMVGMAYVPLLHVLASVLTTWATYRSFGFGGACAAGLAAVYLLPPLAVFAARPRAHIVDDVVIVGTPGFFRWWYTAQWQIAFNRFPQLEEALRVVPGLYSAWLRLWGAKIGRLVYWSPGLQLYDRPFLEIGDRVVIGADTKMSPHFLARGASGATELVLAPIQIGADALIGGSTLLPAGVCVAEREQTPGGRPMAPFSRFENGEHIRTRRFQKDSDHEDLQSCSDSGACSEQFVSASDDLAR